MFLDAIEVRSPGIARERFDALLERQYVSNHLPNAVRVCQTITPGFLNERCSSNRPIPSEANLEDGNET